MLTGLNDEDGLANCVGRSEQRILFHRLIEWIRRRGLALGEWSVIDRIVALAHEVIGDGILVHQCEKRRQVPGGRDVNTSQRSRDGWSQGRIAGGVLYCLHAADLQ